MREYMAALSQSTEVQAVELEKAASTKRAAVNQLKQHISNIDAAITRARENGIDPASMRYAKAG
jgi:signal recognition particle GTPase